jgi:hypothetical protein
VVRAAGSYHWGGREEEGATVGFPGEAEEAAMVEVGLEEKKETAAGGSDGQRGKWAHSEAEMGQMIGVPVSQSAPYKLGPYLKVSYYDPSSIYYTVCRSLEKTPPAAAAAAATAIHILGLD